MKTLKKTKYLFVIIFIIAIIPPLLSIFINNPPPASDEFTYTQIAVSLLNGRGFYSPPAFGFVKLPNAIHPLYPFFIAIIYFFTDHSFTAVKIIQILMHGLACIVIFLIAEKLFRNRLISFFAGIIWALYPLAIYSCTHLHVETLFTFLLALSALFLLKNRQDPNLKNALLSGLFLGLAALTKSVILPFIPVLFLWLILSFKRRLILKLKNAAVIIFFMVLTLSPWLIRNYIVHKQFLPIATGGGLSFYIYNNEKTLTVINDPMRVVFPLTEAQKREISILSESQINRYLYNLGWQFIKSHPKDFIRIRLTELCRFWHLWPAGPKTFTEYYSQEPTANKSAFLDRLKGTYLLYFCKILYHMPYNILFLGMFVSFVTSFKRDREEWKRSLILFLLIAVINGVYIFYHGIDRYRIPIDPYVFILGLHGVISFYKNFYLRYGKKEA